MIIETRTVLFAFTVAAFLVVAQGAVRAGETMTIEQIRSCARTLCQDLRSGCGQVGVANDKNGNGSSTVNTKKSTEDVQGFSGPDFECAMDEFNMCMGMVPSVVEPPAKKSAAVKTKAPSSTQK